MPERNRISLDDKYLSERGTCLIGGVQALVRLPLDQIRRDRLAGLDTGGFISGYRGSPLAGYDTQLAGAKKLLDAHKIHFQAGVNEDLAATAVWGSQQVNLHPGATVDGVFGLWYGKAPGVDRAGDVLKHANMSGVARLGGVLAIAGDDPLAKSSTLASQSEFALIDNEMPVLAAGDIQDLLDLGLHGIAMSRFSGLWVGMVALTDALDGSATVNVDPARLSIITPPDDGIARHITLAGLKMNGRLGAEENMRLVKLPAAKLYARVNRLNRVIWDSASPQLGIIASGKNWSSLRAAFQLLGIDAAVADRLGLRVMKASMPWPLDEADMRDFASGLQTVLVVEAKRPLIETQLKEQLYHWDVAKRPAIIGKRDLTGAPLLSEFGDLSASGIAAVLARMLPANELSPRWAETIHRFERRERFGEKLATPSARAPHFCSGCPHNSSTKIPEGSRAMAGIGCHIMAQTMDGRAEDSFCQMGGEGVAWLGQGPFTQTPHVFANLGDGTYHHSGSLAIRAAVSAKANVTYKILYNDAVAMTGGQRVEGPFGVAEIARQVAAEGVARIAIVAEDPARHSPSDLPEGASIDSRDDLDRIQRELRDTPGVTVLIFDQTCAAEKRRRRKRGEFPTPLKRMFINDRVCEACGDCSVQSNCLSIEPLETAFGTKRQINQSSCNMDYSCAKGFCPSFVVVEGAALKKPEFAPDAIIAAAAGVAEPVGTHVSREVKILLTGIGGTGVTTVSAILAMAAHIDGRQVATLDVTGLAQKGGAVLSHLAIAPADGPAPVAKIAPGGTDCLIAGDLVVSAGETCLTLCDPDRTFAVADEEIAPTSDFVLHQSLAYRSSRPAMRLRNAVHDLAAQPVSSTAKRLLGDTVYANMMLTGMAFQRGRIPLSMDAIERAITLNGTAVKANLAAFHAGRLMVAKPEALPGFTAPAAPVVEDLDALIARLAGELTTYQDAAYAERFRALVARVRVAETALDGAKRLPLTEAVARNGFKLMAYKDEYEVARLYADPAFRAKLAATFEDGGRLGVQLAPPLLTRTDPATGRPRKITFGPWIFTAFAVLAKFKRLRGTPVDPFGWTAERRAERRLAADYERTIDALLPALTSANLGMAVSIARLPEQIRGYGPIKAERMAEAKALEAQLLATFRTAATRPAPQPQLIAAE